MQINEIRYKCGHCVYWLMQDDDVIFVGTTKNLIRRIAQHEHGELNGQFNRIRFIHVETRSDARLLEVDLKNKLQPKLRIGDKPIATKIEQFIQLKPEQLLNSFEESNDRDAQTAPAAPSQGNENTPSTSFASQLISQHNQDSDNGIG